MSIYTKVVLSAICLILVPAGLLAQSDICSTLPSVSSFQSSAGVGNSEIIVEQMKERAAAQALQEATRANWPSKMITLKNRVPTSVLKSLCIFHVEVVPEPELRVLSVRAPQELMASIEDAVKRMDVPQQGPKSVELTVNVLVASDQDESLRPISASVKPVVDQLKGVLTYKQFYLLDTLLSTTIDGREINLRGSVRGLEPPSNGAPRDTPFTFGATLNVGTESAMPTVRLSRLSFYLSLGGNGLNINTDVDVPQGKQVVVGRSTSGDRAYILVVSAKVLN